MAAFYLDEDTPEALAQTLVRYGHTAMTTTQAGHKRAKDYEQLLFAAMQGAIFLTLNRAAYVLLHGAWHHWGVPHSHAGIIVLHHLTRDNLTPIAEEITELVKHPREFLAMQALMNGSVRGVEEITNHLFRRWRDGRWDCLG